MVIGNQIPRHSVLDIWKVGINPMETVVTLDTPKPIMLPPPEDVGCAGITDAPRFLVRNGRGSSRVVRGYA